MIGEHTCFVVTKAPRPREQLSEPASMAPGPSLTAGFYGHGVLTVRIVATVIFSVARGKVH